MTNAEERAVARVMAKLCASIPADRRAYRAAKFREYLKEPELVEVFEKTYDRQAKKIYHRISS